MKKLLLALTLACGAAFGGGEAKAFGDWDYYYPAGPRYYSPYITYKTEYLHPSFYYWNYQAQWAPRVRYYKPRYRTVRVLEVPHVPFLPTLVAGGSPHAREFFDQLDRDHAGSND